MHDYWLYFYVASHRDGLALGGRRLGAAGASPRQSCGRQAKSDRVKRATEHPQKYDIYFVIELDVKFILAERVGPVFSANSHTCTVPTLNLFWATFLLTIFVTTKLRRLRQGKLVACARERPAVPWDGGGWLPGNRPTACWRWWCWSC